jgi:hypothetical protein
MDEVQKIETPPNPLLVSLRARIPGETFRLPSHGLFYKNNELADDVINGEVHVFPMTALDEIILKTPDSLLSGQSVNQVFLRCIPQILKPMKLLSRDVDYLMMCLRMISYGEELDITYTHSCEGAKSHGYVVNLKPLITQAKPIDPTTIGTIYTLKLGNAMVVKLRPPIFESVMNMYLTNFQATNASITLLEAQTKLLDVISDTIVSVDGNENRDHIQEWVKAIPAGWMQDISEALQKIGDWGPSTTVNLTCKDCNQPMEVEIPLNPISFFS